MPDPMGDFAYTWPFYAGFVVAYLIGSIPFGLILTRLAGAGDLRAIGSGNIGATNVLRTGRKGLAALTLLLDGGKGALAVLIGRELGPDMAVIAGAGAVIGHIVPVWLGFRGGKGVATVLGVLLATAWQVGLLVCLIWLLVALAFRYSSLAALISVAASPALMWWLAMPQQVELAVFLAVLVWLRHIGNIRRMIRGEESRIRLGRRDDGGSGPSSA